MAENIAEVSCRNADELTVPNQIKIRVRLLEKKFFFVVRAHICLKAKGGSHPSTLFIRTTYKPIKWYNNYISTFIGTMIFIP